MAWFGKVSLGGLQDLAGAVNKISESVKNIEKNFDTALGLEEKPDSEEGTHDLLFAMPLPIPLLYSYIVYSGGNSIQVINCIRYCLYGNVKWVLELNPALRCFYGFPVAFDVNCECCGSLH